jgi:hypothetical protein
MGIWKRLGIVLLAGALGVACGGDDDDDADGTVEDAAEMAVSDESLDVDDCTLLTNEEVSAFAGTELEATEDGPLGCAYVVPGEVVGDFSIRSYRGDGDAAAAGADLVPTADLIDLDGVGDDAVALDVDGSVNFVVARQGDMFVELVMTFLDVTPDSPELDAAAELAATALDRLTDS